jgi:GGDEF domain-containing protein
MDHPANPPHGRITVSMGGSLIGQPDLAMGDEQWLRRVDEALYRAKELGRNRVELVAPLVAIPDAAATA